MKTLLFAILLAIVYSGSSFGADKMNYSGRLVTATGAPVIGPVNLRFKIYEDAVEKCSLDVAGVPLENGVFNTELNFAGQCPSSTLPGVISAALGASKSLFIEVHDVTNSKTYLKQSIGPVPIALYAMNASAGALVDDILDTQMKGINVNCTNGQVLKTDGSGGFFLWLRSCGICELR